MILQFGIVKAFAFPFSLEENSVPHQGFKTLLPVLSIIEIPIFFIKFDQSDKISLSCTKWRDPGKT